MIGAVCWVPKGVAKALPDEAPRSLEEIDEVVQGLQGEQSSDNEGSEEDEDAMQLEGDGDKVANAIAAARALGVSRTGKGKETNASAVVDELAELNMDAYDDEDEEIRIFGNGGLGAAYYQLGEKDPYLIDDDDDDEDEMENKIIKPSDLLIVAAKTEDGVGILEVHIYEEEDDHEYVHHEVLLSGIPLCLAWLDCNVHGGDKGNFIALGSIESDIEIWDLDASNEVKPVGVLHDTIPESSTKTTKKKKKRKPHEMPSNSVLGLSWNYEYRNVLASGGADATVKVWDVVAQKCEKTVNCHSSKVSDVAWNLKEPTSLLSGSFDSSVVMTDMRAPADTGLRWKVSKDVECVAWNPHTSHSFVVSSEDGFVCGFDVRTASTKGPNCSLFTLHAHDESAASVSYNLAAPNLLATGSHDKTVKLWDLTNNAPALVTKTSPDVGDIFSVSFCKDSPFVLAVGGSSGQLHVWNTITDPNVAQRYSN